MKRLFPILLLCMAVSAYSQQPMEKGLATINRQSAEASIGFLASDALQGREAGSQAGHVTAEYLKSVFVSLGIKPLYGNSYLQPFNAYANGSVKKARSSFQVNLDSIAKYKQTPPYRRLSMQNVLGVIEGKNKNEYVVIGAHYDHLGMDLSLVGDSIFNGADDNASGVSAVIQIAKAFAESGVQPDRTIVFAFWDGEELGLLGSEYFVQACPFLSNIKGYLNFDMIGRNKFEDNPNYVVYFYTEAHPVFADWLKNDIKKYKLELAPNYRPWDKPIGGSDNGSFAKSEIPIIWYHTDGHPDYHHPGDEANKINYPKVVDITKSAYLNLWRLANEKTY